MIECAVGPVTWTVSEAEAVPMQLKWPINTECCDESGLSERPELYAAAVEAMHERTCRRFGVCSLTVRPCTSDCDCRQSTCSSTCDFRKYDLANFTMHPIIAIEEVRVGETIVPEEDYWISGRRWLIPRRGGLLWELPVQDLNAPARSANSWEVTFTVGERPNEMILFAAADLACQLYKFCTNQPCDLPPNAVSVIRDGTTIRLLTGIEAVPSVKIALDVWGDCSKRKKRSRMIHPADFHAYTAVR